MKKVIKYHVYDTDTAHMRGEWWNGETGATHCKESLYQKKTGEFFIHGEGGAASKYAVSLGNNNWGVGEKLIPLSYDSAREWAEKHLHTDEYERLFGDGDGDETLVRLTVVLSAAEKAKMDSYRAKSGKSTSQVVREFIRTL